MTELVHYQVAIMEDLADGDGMKAARLILLQRLDASDPLILYASDFTLTRALSHGRAQS
jgi:hypothetical protein